MRSALSLTLVLIAAMSGHSASACEQQPLRLLLGAAYSQSFEQPGAVDFNFAADLPAVTAAELRSTPPPYSYDDLTTVPASRSYESASVAAVPSRGP
jgi:hypothetical protein